MEEIRDQMELANEISDVISQPVGFGIDMDEVKSKGHGVYASKGCHSGSFYRLCNVLSALFCSVGTDLRLPSF